MRLLKRALTWPCREIAILANSIGPFVNAASGRWHVFRDSPYWVVKHWASAEPRDSEMAAFVQAAKEELELRLANRARLIAQQINDAVTDQAKHDSTNN